MNTKLIGRRLENIEQSVQRTAAAAVSAPSSKKDWATQLLNAEPIATLRRINAA